MRAADFSLPVEGWAMPSQLKHWSASSLNMLAICPRQWQQRYIRGLKEAPGQALVLGSSFHEAQGFNFVQKIESHEDLPVEEVVSYFHDKAWPDEVEKKGGQGEIKWDSDPEPVRALGAKMVTAYRETTSPRIQPTGVEQRFEMRVEGLALPLLGFVDIVQEPGRPIIDMKTAARAQKTMKPDWRLQGRIYQLVHGVDVDWHVITKAKEPTVWTGLDETGLMQAHSDLTDVQTKRYIRELAAMANHYYLTYGPDEEWPALGVAHDWRCNWCAWKPGCPAWEGVV